MHIYIHTHTYWNPKYPLLGIASSVVGMGSIPVGEPRILGDG